MKTENKSFEDIRFFTIKNILILVICFVCLIVYFFISHTLLSVSGAPFSFEKFGHPSTKAPSPAYIKGWMTFSYINHLYNIPPAYLKDSLSLSDTSFPDISIDQYARYHHIKPGALIEKIIVKVTEASRP